MQVVMVMFRADGERRSFSLTRDLTVIGRREDCDLRIPLGDVSRKHCRVVRNGDTISLEDLGSSNGTFVNGQRVQETLLNPGDTVQVGPVVFCVQIDGVPAEEDMAPVFTAPQEPYAEEAAPLEEGVAEGEFEALQEEEVEASLDDFEAVEADDVQPLAEGEAVTEEPALESLEEAGEPSLEALEEAGEPEAEVFVDEQAAGNDLIGQPLEEIQPEEEAVEVAEDEVVLEDFEVIEGSEEGDQPESGEAPAHTKPH